MRRVGKARRRLKRRARLVRQRMWLASHWGPDWQRKCDVYLCSLQLKRGADRYLVRSARRARLRIKLDPEAYEAARAQLHPLFEAIEVVRARRKPRV